MLSGHGDEGKRPSFGLSTTNTHSVIEDKTLNTQSDASLLFDESTRVTLDRNNSTPLRLSQPEEKLLECNEEAESTQTKEPSCLDYYQKVGLTYSLLKDITIDLALKAESGSTDVTPPAKVSQVSIISEPNQKTPNKVISKTSDVVFTEHDKKELKRID